MSGRTESPERASQAALRLRECQHGCKKHLGDVISFFFRFISGNLARGEEGRGMRVGRGACLNRVEQAGGAYLESSLSSVGVC